MMYPIIAVIQIIKTLNIRWLILCVIVCIEEVARGFL